MTNPKHNSLPIAKPNAEQSGVVERLVKRLRGGRPSYMNTDKLCNEAANILTETAAERDTLKASNKALVEALEKLLNCVSDGPALQKLYREQARAALGEGK